jgi:hypothetical protein
VIVSSLPERAALLALLLLEPARPWPARNGRLAADGRTRHAAVSPSGRASDEQSLRPRAQR